MKLKVLRLISLLMVAMLSLTLFAGCGGGSDSSDSSLTESGGTAASVLRTEARRRRRKGPKAPAQPP